MPVGTGFFDTYNKYIEANEGIELILNMTADDFILDENGLVSGVKCTGATGNSVTLNAANGVVVATGGFSKNVELRQAFNTQWGDLGADIPSTNHEGATGDAVGMMMKLNADFIQMNNMQLLPLGDPNTGSLAGAIERVVENRIYVNKEGERFVDEGGRRDDMTHALFEQTDSFMWVIVDAHTYPTGDTKNNFNETIDELVAAGRVFKGDTLEELAEAIGIPAETLIAEIAEFNAHVDDKSADRFNRSLYLDKIDTAPFYAGARVPTVHHTMGGVRINTNAQVLDEQGNVIPRLYAAGEVTGGIHGTNRLGGNALADILVFGRIAGQSAAESK